ncbi:MAG: carboxypeptidase regulatory-like domain-containing protein [Polyangiaceae bacterium]
MHRQLASLAAVALTSLMLCVGCGGDEKPASGSAPAKPNTAKPATTATAAATPSQTAAAAPAKEGNATIKGVVSFSGKAPEMKVPAKRKDADFCKTKEVKYNAVLVKDGKLKDVLVRIAPGGVAGNWKAPEKHAEIDQADCMYSPRMQGVVAGQSIDIKNGDQTLHNVHTYKGTESLFNQAQPKGAAAISKDAPDEASVMKFTCDVHPWMRGFVVVTDHPFFAVSGEDGSFKIEKVPAGKYTVEAWHTQYGLLKKEAIEVKDTGEVTVDFEYKGTEAEPAENKGELNGLW